MDSTGAAMIPNLLTDLTAKPAAVMLEGGALATDDSQRGFEVIFGDMVELGGDVAAEVPLEVVEENSPDTTETPENFLRPAPADGQTDIPLVKASTVSDPDFKPDQQPVLPLTGEQKTSNALGANDKGVAQQGPRNDMSASPEGSKSKAEMPVPTKTSDARSQGNAAQSLFESRVPAAAVIGDKKPVDSKTTQQGAKIDVPAKNAERAVATAESGRETVISMEKTISPRERKDFDHPPRREWSTVGNASSGDRQTAQLPSQATTAAAVPIIHLKPSGNDTLKPARQEGVFDAPLAVGSNAERAAPSTIAAPTAPSATGNPDMARQVANQLAVAIGGQSGGKAEIVLSPKELGRVRLSMSAVDATITLHIASERPETADLMRRHIDVLAQEFRELGYENIGFSFDGQGRQTKEDDATASIDQARATGSDSGDEGEQTMRAPKVSGLDLRL
ncbi:flagellar hook-length control protein FliK [Yoonia sp. SS1-5]|uniref:Flagellar hook-length control protein FliK n=1 Tax=Yoonia rhodophyticola TaxID=3137370 RepID=A0AAN0NJA7_9RHOB